MFSQVVALYRKIGRPEIGTDQGIRATVVIDSEITELRAAVESLNAGFGDYNFTTTADGLRLIIEGTLPSGGYRFFSTLADFIALTPSLSRGVVRSNFYIRDLDYSDVDGIEAAPAQIKNIYKSAAFISALRAFAAAASNADELSELNKIFFVQPFKTGQKTLVIPLGFAPELCDLDVEGIKILEHLSDARFQEKFHIEERQVIMIAAIADVAKETPVGSDIITQLARNWREVKNRYRHDLSAYIKKFSFEGERKKIADAAIEYSTKLNSALAEMTGKILAAPISVAVILALSKAQNGIDFWAGIAGLLVAFIIYRIALKNQELQVIRLTDAYSFILNGLLKKKATFDVPLRNEIEKFEKEALHQKASLHKAIRTYWAIAYLPLVVAAAVTAIRYQDLIKVMWSYLVEAGRTYSF